MNEIVINPINTYLKKAVFSKAAASSRFLNWWNNFFNRAHLKGILHFRSSWTTWLINYRSFRFSEPSGIRILLWRLTVRVRVKTCPKSRDIKIRIIRKLVVITPVVVVAVVLNHPISALRLSMMKLGPILQQANGGQPYGRIQSHENGLKCSDLPNGRKWLHLPFGLKSKKVWHENGLKSLSHFLRNYMRMKMV